MSLPSTHRLIDQRSRAEWGTKGAVALMVCHQLVLTSVLRYVEQLGDQILPRGRSVHQKQRTTVGMRQEAHVDQYLVTQHVDVELVGHVPYQLHEQFALVQVGQMAAVGDGAPGGRRTAFLRKRKRNTTINDTPWHSETLRQPAVSPPSSPAGATHYPSCAQQIDALAK